ncbi:hypothetical protein MY3296_007197 [Beauveria thailandica]
MPSIITIGIDFGTTFSGAAWAISKRPADIHVITNWESEYHGCSDRGKCPTLLQYGTIGHKTPWGYNVPADKDVVRWFKLLLLDEADLPRAVVEDPQFRQVRKQQERLRISPIELVACFLRSLWKHCMENITRALGSGEVDKCKLHIVMTVPAIWPHYVQAHMKSAAGLAGMLQERSTSSVLRTTLEFLSEPEAAALAALAEMHPRPDIEKGDTIIVCDAGGGTADLISYQVDKASSFRLSECVTGEGGLCGGIFVDQNFDDLITHKMEGSPWKGLDSAEKRKFMKDSWENGIKSQFSGNDRSFFAEVPEGYLPDGAMGKRKRLQSICLNRNDLISVFEPVISKICDLVENQNDAIRKKHSSAPKFIILVGGFGCCSYLFKQLVEAYPDSTILNPPSEQSWTAVCRGAVRHALIHKTVGKNGRRVTGPKAVKSGDYIVQSRICRMGYGFKQDEHWNSDKHRQEHKQWNDLDEMYEATNQMNWFLKKGDTLDGASPSTHEFYRLLTASDELDIEEELYFCTSDALPLWETDSVKELCSIKWNKRVDLSKLEESYNSAGQTYWRLKYKIQVFVDGPELRIEIYHNRKKVAAGEVTVEWTQG